MKQVINFCENNKIYYIITLSLKERLKLLFKGSLVAHIDQNVQSSTGRVVSYLKPKIYKQ